MTDQGQHISEHMIWTNLFAVGIYSDRKNQLLSILNIQPVITGHRGRLTRSKQVNEYLPTGF